MRLSILAVLCLLALVQYSHIDALTVKKTFICSSRWKLVFVGVAGNGESVYDRWHNKNTYHCCEMKNGCLPSKVSHHFFLGYKPKKHLRSPLIDDWKRLNIRRVKVDLYKNGMRVAYLIFNGRKSTMSNWFAKHRLLSSSFSGLSRRSQTNYFSMIGWKWRKWFINKSYGGCDSDYGWFAVVEKNKGCKWDSYRRPPPQFLFGGSHGVRWNTLRFNNADFMTVWIKQF